MPDQPTGGPCQTYPSKEYEDFLKYEDAVDASFAWPALELSPDDLWQVHDGTPFVANRPMSRGRFLELSRGMLIELGVERGEANTAGFNRLRRWLPTVAHCLAFDPLSLQAIGNWVEVPAGGGPAPTFKPQKAQLSMGIHYAGGKVARSAEVKIHAINTFMTLLRRQLGQTALTPDGLIQLVMGGVPCPGASGITPEQPT